MKLFKSLLTLILLLFLCTGCANLSAVQQWSKTSMEASQYDNLIATYISAPNRMKILDKKGEQDWGTIARERTAQSKDLKKILSVVSTYMATLSILSADSTVDYETEIMSLRNGFNKFDTNISVETSDALQKITEIILTTGARAYQAKQLSKIIEEANSPLQELLRRDLRVIVGTSFLSDLESEEKFIDNYLKANTQFPEVKYVIEAQVSLNAALSSQKKVLSDTTRKAANIYMVRIAEALNDHKRAKNIAMTDLRSRITADIKTKKDAVHAYLKVLDNISKGHQELYNSRNNLDSKKLGAELYALAVELKKQIQILAES